MKKYYSFSIVENCPTSIAGKVLDINFRVPDGLTEMKAKELEEAITIEVEAYGDTHGGDFDGIDYRCILENVTGRLGIVFEYPATDYTITL